VRAAPEDRINDIRSLTAQSHCGESEKPQPMPQPLKHRVATA
jgi:hypothetical protein